MTRRIALLLPNWVGDAVMATPAVRAVRIAFPKAHVTGICRPYVREVFAGNPRLDELISVGKGREQLTAAWKLRRRGIDLAILFPNSFRSAMFAWLAGCRQRIGFSRHGRRLLLTHRLNPLRDRRGHPQSAPVLLDYLKLARAAGADDASRQMELFTTNKDEAAADAIWLKFDLDRSREVVCLNPGAAFGSAKLWPAEYFAALARRLSQERGCAVLVLCGPAERALASQIAAQAGAASLAAETLSLGLTKACIRRCSLLVTTDSGPRHFAAAFGRPVVSLFGPTHIAWTETFHALETQLQEQVPCGPCQLRQCPTDHRCMTQLRPDTVFSAAIAMLKREQCSRELEAVHAN